MHFLINQVRKCGCGLLKIGRNPQLHRNYSIPKPDVNSVGAVGLSNETIQLPKVLEHPDYFEVAKLFTISDLFNARVHLGHREGSLDERMKPYIFGSRLGHLIIDLDKTRSLLTAALNFTAHVAYRDGIILFVSQNPQNSFMVERLAKEVSEFAHTRYWRLGMLTNSSMMFGAMTRLPDLIIVLNTLTTVLDEHLAITEAAKMAIPVVGIVDTNCNPNLITYPVPGNDDTPVAVNLYCSLFKAAILKGKQKKKEHEEYFTNSEPTINSR
uniref:Small ribosomal subunit protein uS2m n=1 Tax=Lygus hesperus TaxID=30085 RepID=A0A0K8T184_LYGHE